MKLFVFGLGYTAGAFARANVGAFDSLAGTTRSAEKAADLAREGIRVYVFGPDHVDPAIEAALEASDAVLVSVQPDQTADPVLLHYGAALERSPPRSVVYLSTIGVYGDHGGAWIDESVATEPTNPRQVARIAAEQAWLDFGARTGATVVVLRLAGIYGPGRNALDDLASGEARRIDKPGQVFNRIHVDDIGRAIMGALAYPDASLVVNVTDNEPAPAPDVVAYAAALMGRPVPPLIRFEDATLSPMARSFYGANRRVANSCLKRDLGTEIAFPTYREGLSALWAAGEGLG